MTLRSKILLCAALCLVCLFVLPLLFINVASSDAGMALCLVLFFAVDPLFFIVLGLICGTDLKKLWLIVPAAAIFFPLGFSLAAGEFVSDIFAYCPIYLAAGILSMIGFHLGRSYKTYIKTKNK